MAESKRETSSNEEKLENAKEYKAEGNDFHKNKDFKKAIGKYHRALLQLKAIGQSKSSGLGGFLTEEQMEERGYSSYVSPEIQSEVVKLMADCYNNLAGRIEFTTLNIDLPVSASTGLVGYFCLFIATSSCPSWQHPWKTVSCYCG